KDVHTELSVTTDPGQIEGSEKMLLCGLVTPGVMRHPSGHLGQCRGGRKGELSVTIGIDTAELRRYLRLQVLDHCGVQMPATDLPIGSAERLHGRGVASIVTMDGALVGDTPVEWLGPGNSRNQNIVLGCGDNQVASRTR